jgi:hypothetical protein
VSSLRGKCSKSNSPMISPVSPITIVTRTISTPLFDRCLSSFICWADDASIEREQPDGVVANPYTSLAEMGPSQAPATASPTRRSPSRVSEPLAARTAYDEPARTSLILFREPKPARATWRKASHLQRLNRPLLNIDGIAQVSNSQTACRHVKGARENLIWILDFGPHSVRSVS